ncbi:MAG TPA: prepilin-type N-terminal cleavage/methylation domain-containing protein [Candidatus Angelobacter sp.]|nr:prepilin-type N-terminal cleavage/methylation domain-containing protein [Candidatus Angelobacter sp.]
MSHPKKKRLCGFALIEVMIAIAILAVGLLGLAALLANLTGTTTQSRYLSTEVMLASEKLEDLNQRDAADPLLDAGGSLTADDANYSDVVQTSSTNGIVNDQAVGGALGATSDLIQYKRRWVIESNTPAPLVRRITVIIIPQTGSPTERRETFQTSMVRPCDAIKGC